MALFLSDFKRVPVEFSALRRIVLSTVLCCGLPLAQAQEQTPYALPNPLTLQDVMSASLQAHPLVVTEQANLAKIQAQLGAQQAQDGLQLDLVGRLAWRDYAKETEEFHLAALHARQSLYDFDRNRSQVEALQRHEEAQTLLFENAENQLKLQLMQGFFNVLLADFQYRIDNEAMAVAYVGLDKAKDELDLKRLSDVDYLKLENEYQQILVKRSRSEYQQLQTRLALANLMGLPDARPDELTFPALKNYAQRSLNETTLEKLQQNVLQENPELNALKKRLEAAQLKVQSQQAAAKPDIALEGWAGQLSSYPEKREGNWNIGLTLNMPLYDSGLRDAKVSEAKADEQAVAAQIGLYEQKLRDKVADIYFQIKLLEAERKQNKIFGDYADLYLDYSRALYENESKTDLGDAMVRLSEANYNQVAWQFKQALLWASLDSLTGKALFENAEASNSQAQQAELPQ